MAVSFIQQLPVTAGMVECDEWCIADEPFLQCVDYWSEQYVDN